MLFKDCHHLHICSDKTCGFNYSICHVGYTDSHLAQQVITKIQSAIYYEMFCILVKELEILQNKLKMHIQKNNDSFCYELFSC